MRAIQRWTALFLGFLLLCGVCTTNAADRNTLPGVGRIQRIGNAGGQAGGEEAPQETDANGGLAGAGDEDGPGVTLPPFGESTPEASTLPENPSGATETPEPTEPSDPTETPEPTEPSDPTETPESTEAPESTDTAEPTEPSDATETPKPEDEADLSGVDRAQEHTDGGPIVFTFTQLKEAIENGNAPIIYLGYGTSDENGETNNGGVIRFSQAGGMIARRSITIVGIDPRNQRRVTLEDYASSLLTDTLRVGVAGLTIHLRDMNVIGHNFFGIVHVPSLATSVAFTNVSYTGRQIVCAYGAGTSVSFTDCAIQIQNMDGNSGEEVAEAAEIRLYGNNTITRNATFTGATWSMFWLNASPYRMTVNGQATLETNNYFIYDPTNSAQLIVNGALRVATSGNNGSMTNAGYYLSGCDISSSGALHISHIGSAYASLRVRSLNVAGTLTIDKTNASQPCIALYTGGSAAFESPAYVRLANPGGRLMDSTAGTAGVRIVTQAMNRWQGSGEPMIWNNRNMGAYTTQFSINASGASSGFSTTLEGGKGAAYGAVQLSGSALDFYGSPKVTFGQYTLTIDDVYIGRRGVSGTASGGTQTVFEYDYTAGMLGAERQSIAAEGNYRAELTSSVQKNSMVYVKSVMGDLQAHTYTWPLAGVFFHQVPESLEFGTIPISASPRVISRLDPDWTLSVNDTREAGGLWEVYASAEPFVSEGGAVLDGMLLFVEGENAYSLQGVDVRIAKQPTDAWETITDIVFPAEEGLLLSLNGLAGKPGARYESTITWTLQVGP